MTHAQKIGVSVVATAGVTAVAAFVTLRAMGIGHGSYVPAALLFPFAMIPAFFINDTDWLIMTLALLQFPIYGTFIGRAWLSARLPRTALAVSIVHIVTALGCVAAVLL